MALGTALTNIVFLCVFQCKSYFMPKHIIASEWRVRRIKHDVYSVDVPEM